MFFDLFRKEDENKISRKRKESIGDKIITKTAYDVLTEKEQRKLDLTCPECNEYHSLNGGFVCDSRYSYHSCRFCKCEWKVRKK